MHDELRAVAEGLAARLGRAVAIDDPQMRLLVHTPHDEQVDELRVTSVLTMQVPDHVVAWVMEAGIADSTGPVRIPPRPEAGMLGRVAVPIRCEGRLFGYLWLIDDPPTLTDDDLSIASDAAAAASLILHRERLLGDRRDSRDRELLRDLLSDEAGVRAHAAEALAGTDRLPLTGAVVVMAVRVGEATLQRVSTAATELDSALQRAALHLTPLPALATSRSGGRGTVIVAAERAAALSSIRGHADDLQAWLAKTLDADDVRVGIGPTVEGLLEARRSWQAAEDVLRVTAVVPGFGPVAAHHELGIYRLLVHLPVDQLPVDAIPAGLRTLISRDAGGQLIETLETYLDAAGDARAAVEQLRIHRTSLYYRLSRIEEIAGMSLANGGDRLALHLGLKLARLLGQLPDTSPSRSRSTPH
jgi:sugar diacid utilization regulator